MYFDNVVLLFDSWMDKIDRIDSPYSNPRRATFSQDQMTASVDLPGYGKEDITVSILSDTCLHIKASNKSRGEATVKLNTPTEIAIEQTDVSYSNGVLVLKFVNKSFSTKTLQVK